MKESYFPSLEELRKSTKENDELIRGIVTLLFCGIFYLNSKYKIVRR